MELIKLEASIPPKESAPDLPGGARSNEEIDAILAAQETEKPERTLAEVVIDDVAKTSIARLAHSVVGGIAEGSRELLRTGVMIGEDVLVEPWHGIGNSSHEITQYYDSLIPHYTDTGQLGEGQAPQTAVENITQGLSQFLGVFGVGSKVLQSALKAGPVASNIGASVVADIGALSEDTPNITDLIGPLHPYLQQYVTDILGTSDHNVQAIERKFRAGATGMMPFAFIVGTINAARGARVLWNASVTQKILADERGSMQIGKDATSKVINEKYGDTGAGFRGIAKKSKEMETILRTGKYQAGENPEGISAQLIGKESTAVYHEGDGVIVRKEDLVPSGRFGESYVDPKADPRKATFMISGKERTFDEAKAAMDRAGKPGGPLNTNTPGDLAVSAMNQQAATENAFQELKRQVPRAQQVSFSKLVEDAFTSGEIPKPPIGLADESGRISYGLAYLIARAAVGATAGAYATDGSEIGAFVGLLAGASGPAAARTLIKMVGPRSVKSTVAASSTEDLLRSFKASAPKDVYTKLGDIRRSHLALAEAQTRGVRPDELVQAEAKAMTEAGKINKDFVLNYLGKPGSLLNDSELLAVGSVIDEEAVKGQVLITRALKVGTPEAYAEGFKQIELLSNMGAAWKGFAAETGRSERTFGAASLIRGVTQWAKDFEAALKETGGTPRELFAQFAQLSPRQAAVYAQSLNKPGTWEMWRELWINSLLWGKALVVNPIGNALQLEWEVMKRAPLELVGAVPPGTTYNMFKEQARIHGMRDAIVAGYRAVLKGTDDLGKIDMAHEPAITAENIGIPPGLFGKFIDAMGSVVRGSGNILRGEDTFARGIAGRVALREYAYRTAYQEVQAMRLSNKYAGPRIDGKQAIALIQQKIDQIMSAPPLEAISYYKNFEKVVTFTEELGPVGQALQQFQQTRIGTITTPFVKVLYNIPKQAARNSPLAPVLPSFWADVKSGDPHRRNLAISGMAMGTGLAMILADLANSGVITGNGPSDPQERVLMKERLGWKPMSVRIGDEYISLNQAAGAFAVPMGIMADYVYLKAHMLEGEWEDFALLMTQSFANNFSNKTFMKGLAGWLSALTDPEQGAKRAISDFVTSLAPFSTAVRIIEQEMDPLQREAHTILEKVQSRLPILSKGLPIHPDIFGNPVAVEGAIGPDALSPLYFSTIKDDKIADEMRRVGAFPGDHASQVMGTKLTTTEISRLAVITGKEFKAPNSRNEEVDLYDQMKDVIASDEYKDFKDFPEMQKSILLSLISKYRQAGSKMLLNENADLRNRVTATFKKKGREVSPEDFQLN